MKDILEDIIDKGIPVIDNTKDAAYYRNERLQRDLDNVAKHQFVENVEGGPISLDENGKIKRRYSFDLVHFQHEMSPFEESGQLDAAIKKQMSSQLLEIARIR